MAASAEREARSVNWFMEGNIVEEREADGIEWKRYKCQPGRLLYLQERAYNSTIMEVRQPKYKDLQMPIVLFIGRSVVIVFRPFVL